MNEANCDIWLLTDVRLRVSIEGHYQHLSQATIADGRHWAGILSRQQPTELPDPHATSALAVVGGLTVCSSMLPWPLMDDPALQLLWDGEDHVSRATNTIKTIKSALTEATTIWGGDWNQPLAGNIVGFSRGVQESLLGTLDELHLRVTTDTLRAHNGLQNSIDHIAIPKDWLIADSGAIKIDDSLGEHDIYWVSANPVL